MSALSQEQLERQDFVDNAVHALLNLLNPREQRLEWDIEMIADVRETIQYWLVHRHRLCDEMAFYPYVGV
jgi:hypothetical protein